MAPRHIQELRLSVTMDFSAAIETLDRPNTGMIVSRSYFGCPRGTRILIFASGRNFFVIARFQIRLSTK